MGMKPFTAHFVLKIVTVTDIMAGTQPRTPRYSNNFCLSCYREMLLALANWVER